jgi:hypothetical protein
MSRRIRRANDLVVTFAHYRRFTTHIGDHDRTDRYFVMTRGLIRQLERQPHPPFVECRHSHSIVAGGLLDTS